MQKKDFQKLLIDKDLITIEALKVLDKGSYQFLMIVDSLNKLLGVITDGDIRRGLINGKNLNNKISEFMNKDFLSIKSNENIEEAYKLMYAKKIKQIPVIDEKGIIKDLILKDGENSIVLDNYIVIMAGGKGKRLYPMTKDCPKPMLKVSGKPMLEILLEQCISFGYKNFYISVNYLKESIINYFGDGKNLGINIKYLEEESPLGTAGALSLMKEIPQKPFLVINADVLTKFNLQKLLSYHIKNKSDATLCVREYNYQLPFGVVKTFKTELIEFKEKPSYKELINAGVYILNPEILKLLKKNKYLDMPELLMLAKENQFSINVCPIYEYWIDIGRRETLQKAHEEWDLL
jgi:dTDP-glucose pyrophosphorylase